MEAKLVADHMLQQLVFDDNEIIIDKIAIIAIAAGLEQCPVLISVHKILKDESKNVEPHLIF